MNELPVTKHQWVSPHPSQRVVVAMSGGVDSSVVAAILQQQGYEVVGVTLQMHPRHALMQGQSGCGSDSITRARTIAAQLAIPHYVVDCVSEFEQQVLQPAWREYAHGRTPSPCLRCNERIKFGMLLDWAKQIGAASVATGHYARTAQTDQGEIMLLRGLDPDKDQSYFLAGLNDQQLNTVLFPLGSLTKSEVRQHGRNLDLASAETQDSQDACLAGPNQSFAELLRQRFGDHPRPGLVINQTGQVVGQHTGIHHFTVGQRKGLDLQTTSRHWVTQVRADDAAVVVSDDPQALESRHLVVADLNWLIPEPQRFHRPCEVQIRYRHQPQTAVLSRQSDGRVLVEFDQPVRAVTPGQAAVFYDGPRVLGRGWIES